MSGPNTSFSLSSTNGNSKFLKIRRVQPTRHAAAVVIDEADAAFRSFDAGPGRRGRRRLEAHAEVVRGLLQQRERRRLRGHVERAGPIGPFHSHVFVRRHETVDDDEAVGRLVREVIADRRALRGLDRAGRRLREVGQRLERPVEPSRMRSNCTPIWNASV